MPFWLLLSLVLDVLVVRSRQRFYMTPGARYLDFMKKVNEQRRIQLRDSIFDPHMTKKQVLVRMREKVHYRSMIILQDLDRSILAYEAAILDEMDDLNRRSHNLSNEAWDLEHQLWHTYQRMDLSERDACGTAERLVAESDPFVVEELEMDPFDCEEIFENLIFDYHRHP